MISVEPGSVSRWLLELKAGRPEAAHPIWDRYFDLLVRVARRRLIAVGANRAAGDEEDAAISAFHSFCKGAALARFSQLTDREDLWELLILITIRKVASLVRRETRIKRGSGRLLGEGALEHTEVRQTGVGLDGLEGNTPGPEFIAAVREEYCRLFEELERLGDPVLREVALQKMSGYTVAEIASRLGRSGRTIDYKLNLIRKTWERVS